MKLSILICGLLLLVPMSNPASAAPVSVRLDAHNQRSSSGTLTTLKWKTCAPTGATTPCLSTTNAWTLANAAGSTAVWTWDAATGVLSMAGTFQTTSFVSSNPNGSPVISDKVVNMVIDTVNDTTTASSYQCIEGTFLSSVGANGCLNTSTGNDFVNGSSALYNVGANANCVQRTVGGDDVGTGNPRGLTTATATGACDSVDGAFDLWTIEKDDTATGGQLIIRNSMMVTAAGTAFLTFTAAPDAVDDGPFDALQSVPKGLDVLANDKNFTDPVSVTISAPPNLGAATVQGTNPGPRAGIAIQYTANAAATGTDSFVYTVVNSDGIGTDTGTVTINVQPSGANDDAATTEQNEPVQIAILQNDTGLAATVDVGIWINPVHGSAEVSGAPGSPAGVRVTYVPNPGFVGADSFEYWVESGLVVDYAVVSINVINTDPDGDGVAGALDNCSLVANPTQCDSDGDGYGNHCDGDLTNNGFTNAQDTVVLRGQLGGSSLAPTYNKADLNCNGFVNAQDTVLFRHLLGLPPGPSGLHP